jgi:hypothetical protein
MTPFLVAGIIAVLSLVLHELSAGEGRTVVTLLAVTGVFLGLHLRPRLPRLVVAAWVTALPLMIAGFAVESAERVARNLSKLPTWDYLGFWLHARTAVMGDDFYDPRHAQELALPFQVNEAFQHEIVNAGFWYPPPTMFLFLPLGLVEPATALPWWYAAQVLAAIASVVLLRRWMFPDGGVVEGLAIAAVLAATHGTYETFHFAQTNFIALLLVILFWTRSATWAGGAWLGAAIFVKPFVALLAAGPLLARQWRSLMGFTGSVAVLLGLSSLAFGADALARWIRWDMAASKPEWIYNQPTNQSLLGLVLRQTGTVCQGVDCITHPVFLAVAGFLTLVTVALAIALTRSREHEWTIALFLLLALIVYPVSQLFYTVMLLPPVLLVWRRRELVPSGGAGASIVLGLVFALTAYDRGRESIHAFLLMWTVLTFLGLRIAWPRTNETRAGMTEPSSAIA